MIRLRQAGPDDVDRLAALDEECFGTPWSRDVWVQEVTRPFAQVVIAEHDELRPATVPDDRFHGLVGASCLWVVGDEAHLLRLHRETHPRAD